MIDSTTTNQQYGSYPSPYLVAATDRYYNVASDYVEKQRKKLKKSSKPASRKNLRILITTYWDYPAVGGLQNYITTLKNELEKLGHHVDIVAPNQFPKNSKELKKKLVKETKQFYTNRYGCYNKKIVKENARLSRYEMILRTMDLENYDIFHAQDRFTANVIGRLNKEYNKPLLFTPHGFMTQRKLSLNLIERGSLEEAFYLSLDQIAIECSDRVIALCEAFRPSLKKIGARDHQITTVYTGIDNHFEPKSKTKNNKKVITCISRLRPRKGHKYLFDALASIESELDDVEVWIVGDGEMREELVKQVQELKLNNVTFLGERKDIPTLLSLSDIFVLPTTSDTLPISIIEAMFAEKPILTTNIGGIPEIIANHHTGLLVESGDSKQLAESLSLLLSDATLREALAQNARTFAEKNLCSVTMAEKIVGIYQSIRLRRESR